MSTFTLKNSEICTPDFQAAIRNLAEKKLPAQAVWIVADLLEYAQRRMKKHQEAVRTILLNHGGKEIAPGRVNMPTGDNSELFKELENLDCIEGKIELPEIMLPAELELEPIVAKELRQFLANRKTVIKELE